MTQTYIFTGAAGGTLPNQKDWNGESDVIDNTGKKTWQYFNWTVYNNYPNDLNNGAPLSGLYATDPLPNLSANVVIGAAGGSTGYQVTIHDVDSYGNAPSAFNLTIANGSSLTLNGPASLTIAGTLTNEGLLVKNNSDIIVRGGSIVNDNIITVNGYDTEPNNGGRLLLSAGTTTLTGAGTLRLHGEYQHSVIGSADANATSYLENYSTIIGSGMIGGADIYGNQPNTHLILHNHGTLNADASDMAGSNPRGVELVDDATNDGLIETTGSDGLELYHTNLVQSASGTIAAYGPGTHIFLDEATVSGGIIDGSGGGDIRAGDIGGGIPQKFTLDGRSASSGGNGAVTITHNGMVTATRPLILLGTIRNGGQIVVQGLDNPGLNIGAGDVTLTGITTGTNGEVILQSGAVIIGAAPGTTLHNVQNAILGGGKIQVDLDNQVDGIVQADNPSEALQLQARVSNEGTLGARGATLRAIGWTLTNNGILEANAGTLDISDPVAGTGVVQITGGGTARFSNVFNQNVTFQGKNAGTLSLAQAYAGIIVGMDVGDKVDLSGLASSPGNHLYWQPNAPNTGGALYVLSSTNAVLTTVNIAGHHRTGDFTLTNDGSGHTLISETRALAQQPGNDFNGDGTSDMLWQFKSSGGVYDFSMTNGQVTSSPLVMTVPSASWSFLGTGDFNGDGTSDQLWQYKAAGNVYEATGGVYDFQMSNGQVTDAPIQSRLLTTLPSSSWTYLASGDFNGDGTSDMLWQYNATGGVYDFTMSNGQLTGSPLVTTLPSSSWAFLGTGDFNGDGTSDQLWQFKATGGVYDFTMSNGQVTASPLVTTLPSSSWSYLGSGDFNGDGTSDMLWQYQPTGGIYDFQMSNGQVASSPLVTTLPANVWTFLGTGDFNGDGTSDFLMQYNPTGGVYDFGMSNGQLTSSPLVTTLPASSWSHLA